MKTNRHVKLRHRLFEDAPDDTKQSNSLRSSIAAAIYFLLVTGTFAWPVVFGRHSNVIPGVQSRLWPWQGITDSSQPLFPQRDGAVSSYPWSVVYHNALQAGHLPFWDWHSFSGGYDLASDGVSGAMYPLHWLVWVLFNPPLGHDVFMILHLWLGGLVMYFLLRHWQTAILPALLGGTVWMLSAFNTGWLQAEMITPVLLIVPLAFWRIDCAVRVGTLRNRAAAAGALALGLVAGNIVVFLVIGWVAGLYAVGLVLAELIRRRDMPRLLHQVRTLLVVSGGAVGLASYSLVPTLANLLSLGRRTATLTEAASTQVPLLSSVLGLWNNPAPIETTGSLFGLGWCGRIALLLALVGTFRFHRGRVVAVSAAIFFTFLPASSYLVHVGWYAIPPLRAVSGFGRLLFLYSFGIAVLAGLGLEQLLLSVKSVRARFKFSLVASVIGSVVGSAMIVAVLLEMVPFALAVNPPWRAGGEQEFYPTTGAVRAIASGSVRDGSWPGLLLPITVQSTKVTSLDTAWSGTSFWGATANVAAIDSVGGYDSAVPWRAATLTRIIQGTGEAEAVRRFSTAFLPDFSLTWSRLDLLRRMGITHIYGPPGLELEGSAYWGWVGELHLIYDAPDGRVWEVANSQRSPKIVEKTQVVTDAEEALKAFIEPNFDSSTSVVLERGTGTTITPPAVGSTAGAPAPGIVLTSERGSNSAAVNVEVVRDGWLVMPIGYSGGWTARIDGVRVDTRPANFAYTAIRVASGAHRVTFEYRPPGFKAGSAATLTTVGAAIGYGLLRKARRGSPGYGLLRKARRGWLGMRARLFARIGGLRPAR